MQVRLTWFFLASSRKAYKVYKNFIDKAHGNCYFPYIGRRSGINDFAYIRGSGVYLLMPQQDKYLIAQVGRVLRWKR